MSNWIDLYLGPGEDDSLEAGSLEALVADLLSRGVVEGPGTLVVGSLAPDASGEVEAAASGRVAAGLEVVVTTQDHGVLLQALRTRLGEGGALALYFPRLAWGNPEIGPVLEEEGYANGSVMLFHLEAPVAFQTFDAMAGEEGEEFEFRTCVVISGNGVPEELSGTLVDEILEEHLGELIQGCSIM